MSGSKDKGAAFLELCTKLQIAPKEAAMLGDDLPDLCVMRECGFAIAVNDASAEVLAAAQMVTKACGGNGAVREVIEHLLRAQNRWDDAVRVFDPKHDAARAGAAS